MRRRIFIVWQKKFWIISTKKRDKFFPRMRYVSVKIIIIFHFGSNAMKGWSPGLVVKAGDS